MRERRLGLGDGGWNEHELELGEARSLWRARGCDEVTLLFDNLVTSGRRRINPNLAIPFV